MFSFIVYIITCTPVLSSPFFRRIIHARSIICKNMHNSSFFLLSLQLCITSKIDFITHSPIHPPLSFVQFLHSRYHATFSHSLIHFFCPVQHNNELLCCCCCFVMKLYLLLAFGSFFIFYLSEINKTTLSQKSNQL